MAEQAGSGRQDGKREANVPLWSGVALALAVAALFAFVGMQAVRPGDNVSTPEVVAPEPEPELPSFVPDLPEVPDLSAGPAPDEPLVLDASL